MWLPSGSRIMNSNGAPGVCIGSSVEIDTADGAQAAMFGEHVGRLHAHAATAR